MDKCVSGGVSSPVYGRPFSTKKLSGKRMPLRKGTPNGTLLVTKTHDI